MKYRQTYQYFICRYNFICNIELLTFLVNISFFSALEFILIWLAFITWFGARKLVWLFEVWNKTYFVSRVAQFSSNFYDYPFPPFLLLNRTVNLTSRLGCQPLLWHSTLRHLSTSAQQCAAVHRMALTVLDASRLHEVTLLLRIHTAGTPKINSFCSTWFISFAMKSSVMNFFLKIF